MQNQDFAQKAKLSDYDFKLMLHGNSSLTLQDRYQVSMGEIDVFISQNIVSEDFAKVIGASVAATEEFGAKLGRDGRLGFFIGFLMQN